MSYNDVTVQTAKRMQRLLLKQPNTMSNMHNQLQGLQTRAEILERVSATKSSVEHAGRYGATVSHEQTGSRVDYIFFIPEYNARYNINERVI